VTSPSFSNIFGGRTMKKVRSVLTLSAVALFASTLILTACGDDSSSQSSDSDTTVASSDIDGTFSLTVPQVEGDLTFDAPPTRIISLSPTATEMLWAIGAGDQVVAIDNMSNYPAEAQEKASGLSGFEPSIEAIADYNPDLVLVSYAPEGMADGLAALNIPVWYGYAPSDVDDVYAQIEILGAITGNVSNAAGVVADMKTKIDAAVSEVGDVGDATYFYELDNTYYSVTSNTFIGSLMTALGLTNIADGVQEGNDYPQLNAEVIIDKDPTFIFLADTAYGESAQTVAARPGWSTLGAVTGNRVVELDSDIASRWGPRMVDLVLSVADAVSAASIVAQ
jgi:iron complex transport system substrate-binding protein